MLLWCALGRRLITFVLVLSLEDRDMTGIESTGYWEDLDSIQIGIHNSPSNSQGALLNPPTSSSYYVESQSSDGNKPTSVTPSSSLAGTERKFETVSG